MIRKKQPSRRRLLRPGRLAPPRNPGHPCPSTAEARKCTARWEVTVRRMRAVFTAFWSIVFAASAYSQDTAVTVHTSAGFIYGVARELVVDGGFTVSELDWEMKPVFFEQTTLDVRAFGGLHAILQVRGGIPARSGIMTDSDWLNYLLDATNTVQTNYSQNNNFTDRAISVEARIGWELAAGGSVRIEPFLYAGYTSWKWSGRDGYLQYPPGWFQGTATPPYPSYTTDSPIQVYGTGIVYEQTYLIPGGGVRLETQVSQKWTITAVVTFSPWLYCSAFDTHAFRSTDFADTMQGGWMIEPEIDVTFIFNPRAALSLQASFLHIGNLIGTDTETATGPAAVPPAGTQTVYPDIAGAGFDALSVAVTFSLTI